MPFLELVLVLDPFPSFLEKPTRYTVLKVELCYTAFKTDVPPPLILSTWIATFNACLHEVFMQQDWSLLELSQHFTLSVPELALLGNKTGATRLGFAVLLKFFQYQSRFPFTKTEIPRSVIAYLAPQVKVPISQHLAT